ncbi:hypothetical protein NP493_1098g00054 [Ridgeia piscesae]|uniref:EF-hand domain-containing protein n=1 Tax=Ridgeia piscesae TaxID=27915 RepID=A0AAD9KH31_RIDPI|nr:hypothetical protein NP493_1098g00054 [Ridgeia piscesae]
MRHLKSEDKQADDDLIDVFRILDQDGDGYISQADLRDIMNRLGLELSQQEMEEMIAEVDKDGDGQIDYDGAQQICLIKFLF